jgi:orotate phosphoribosyltransferase
VLWNVCVNLEGVLCPRPHGDVRDESAYRSFLEGAGPLVVPSKEVGWVVSHRPEEYRDATEAWLERHGVEYETLVMADPGTEPSVVEHGVDVYDSTGALLFVEGSHSRAGEIASRTGRPVYAYESGEMVRAPTAARTQREVMDRTRRYLSKVANDPVAFLSEATEYVSTRGRYHAHLMLKSIRE